MADHSWGGNGWWSWNLEGELLSSDWKVSGRGTEGTGRVFGGVSFLFPLPSLSQLFILRPQVEKGEGVLHVRVPTATGRQTDDAAIPGSSLVGWGPPGFPPEVTVMTLGSILLQPP